MMSPTQVFSNVKIDGVLVRGKQDAGTEINVMPSEHLQLTESQSTR